jgi:hypothetical protein
LLLFCIHSWHLISPFLYSWLAFCYVSLTSYMQGTLVSERFSTPYMSQIQLLTLNLSGLLVTPAPIFLALGWTLLISYALDL